MTDLATFNAQPWHQLGPLVDEYHDAHGAHESSPSTATAAALDARRNSLWGAAKRLTNNAFPPRPGATAHHFTLDKVGEMLTPRQSIESVDDADRHARLLAHWSGADPVHPTDAEHFHIKRSNEHFGGRQFPALVKQHTGFEVDPHSGRTHEGTGDIRYSVNLRAPATAEWRNESKTMPPSSPPSSPPSVAEAVGAYLTAKRRLYVVECHLNGIPMLEADDPMNPTIKNFGDIVQHYGHKSLGPRQMGSTTDAALHDLIPHSTPVEEFRPHKDADVPIAKYYRLHKKDVQPEVWEKINPKLGAAAYSSLSRAERANVKVRPGHAYGSAGFGDGRELYVDREPHQQHARGADHLTFIMGPIGDKLGAWTWHPGEALPVHDSHFTHGKASAHPEEIAKNPRYSAAPIADSFKSPNPKPMTAVKLHNG